VNTNKQQEDIAQHRFAVTFFPNKFATSLEVLDLTLEELADEILGEKARSKAELSWLKLMRFGDKPSTKGCLRTNANAIVLTGIEVEHDEGTISFDDAISIMQAAALRCLLYTSPSYSPGVKERWRILLPCSVEAPLGLRSQLVARVNWLFEGKLADESFNLSLAYLFGAVKDNPHHQAVVLDGDCIDLADDIAETGKRQGAEAPGAAAGAAQDYSEDDIIALLVKSQQEGQWHNAMLSATAWMVNKRWSDARIMAACAAAAIGGEHDVDVAEMVRGARLKFGIPDPDTIDRVSEAVGDFVRMRAAACAAGEVAGTLFRAVVKPGKPATLDDFHAYLPTHTYVFMPTRELWPSGSVNSVIMPIPVFEADGTRAVDGKGKPKSIKAGLWLDRNKPLEQMTWAPGEGDIICDRLMAEGGWMPRDGARVLNLYRPPLALQGDPNAAGPWIEYMEMLYPDDAGHLIKWFAHRAQRPAEKVNHMIVMGGLPGIGKDTVLEAVKLAIGPWNMSEVSPAEVMGRFNGFGQAVIVRISEVHDLGDVSRYAFYDRTKRYGAAPPDALRIDTKNTPEYYIPNVCGGLITTNYLTDGMYLPATDRRHYVAWSDVQPADCVAPVAALWKWYASGGFGHVAAYLKTLDISDFDPKATPRKTPAFHAIVDAHTSPEVSEMADLLDVSGNPDAVTLEQLQVKGGFDGFGAFLRDRKNRTAVRRRLEDCGYTMVRSDASDHLWVIAKKRQAIYVKKALSARDQHVAAEALKHRLSVEKTETEKAANAFFNGKKPPSTP